MIKNSNPVFNNKNDLSYDMYRNNTNNYFSNVINKAYTPSQLGTTDEITNKKRNKHKSSDKILDNTVMYDENYKSPDISSITNNLLSPCSYRVDQEKSNINYNMLNMTNLNARLNNSIVNFNPGHNKHNLTTDAGHVYMYNQDYLNTVDDIFDKTDEKFLPEQEEIVKKIKLKILQIKDEHENLRRIHEDIQREKESMYIIIIICI